MKRLLIATAIIFITGIISSCSKPQSVTTVAMQKDQLIITCNKKDLGSAD